MPRHLFDILGDHVANFRRQLSMHTFKEYIDSPLFNIGLNASSSIK